MKKVDMETRLNWIYAIHYQRYLEASISHKETGNSQYFGEILACASTLYFLEHQFQGIINSDRISDYMLFEIGKVLDSPSKIKQ